MQEHGGESCQRLTPKQVTQVLQQTSAEALIHTRGLLAACD